MTPPSLKSLEQALNYHRTGELDKAIDGYRQILQKDPTSAIAWDYLGIALRSSGDMLNARKAGEKAVKFDPDSAQACSNLGNTLAALGKDTDALANYIKALDLSPGFGDAWANRGMAEKRLGRNTDAKTSLSRAAKLMPENASALNDIGNQLFELSAYQAAIICYTQATDQNPAFTNAWNNLGNTHLHILQSDDALRAYEQAIAQDQKHREARNGYAQTLLLKGDYRAGFPAYEARFDKPDAPTRRTFASPLWAGEGLQGKSILLYAEQGLGDTLQFLRFAKVLKDMGARIVLECQESLMELASTAPGVDQIIRTGEVAQPTDFNAPLMSLPYLLGLTQTSHLQTNGPYIQINKAPPIEDHKSDTRRIGIVWSGNPDHVNDANRSMSLSDMAPLFELPETRFMSLQVGPSRSQISTLNNPALLADLGGSFQNLKDTASAIARLDLVITVDTAVAHLAGAMGRPCWVLLPYVPDWRWLLGRDDSPWYPSLRLFRQQSPGDWKTVIKNVSRVLENKDM